LKKFIELIEDIDFMIV